MDRVDATKLAYRYGHRVRYTYGRMHGSPKMLTIKIFVYQKSNFIITPGSIVILGKLAPSLI